MLLGEEQGCYTSQGLAAQQRSEGAGVRPRVGPPMWLERAPASSDFTLSLRGRPVKATPWAMATFPSMCFLLVCLKKKKKSFASFCSGLAETQGNQGELRETVCPGRVLPQRVQSWGWSHTLYMLTFLNTKFTYKNKQTKIPTPQIPVAVRREERWRLLLIMRTLKCQFIKILIVSESRVKLPNC